jgi:cell division protease FtsH
MADALIEVETINHQQVDNLVQYGTLQGPEDKKDTDDAKDTDADANVPSADDSAKQAEPEAHVEISPWGNAVPSDSKE